MDFLDVSRKGLERIVEETITDHPAFILFRKKNKGWFSSPLVGVKLNPRGISEICAQVEIRFGLDFAEQVDSLNRLIRENMRKITGLSIDRIKIKIRDVYDEQE